MVFDSHAAHAVPVPGTLEEWKKVPPVGEGTASMVDGCPEANFIRGQLEAGIIRLEVTPEQVRCLYPFLHELRKVSFRQWYYKVRGSIRASDTLQTPSDKVGIKSWNKSKKHPPPAKGKVAPLPSLISAESLVDPNPPPFYKKPRYSPVASRTIADEMDDDPIQDFDEEAEDIETIMTSDPRAMKLPHFFSEWKDTNREGRLTLVIFMIGGGYLWRYTQKPSVGILKMAWPETLTAQTINKAFKPRAKTKEQLRKMTPTQVQYELYLEAQENENSSRREIALNDSLCSFKKTEGDLIWSTMRIPMPKIVVAGETNIKFVEKPANADLLGPRWAGSPVSFFDRYMAIDLKIPTDKFKSETEQPTVFLDSDD